MDKTKDAKEEAPTQKKLNYFEGLINLIKCILGAGILAGPYGFFKSGWLLAFVTMSIIVFTFTYSTRILIKSMRQIGETKESDDITYPDAVDEGFKDGPPCLQKMHTVAPIIVKCFLVLYHFNCGPIYIVVISESLNAVLSQHNVNWDVRIYMAILIPFIILIFLINNLKALTPFSILATLLILLGLCLIIYYMIQTKMPPVTNLKLVNDVIYMPSYVGVILLTIASPGVVLAIESAMRDRHQFISYIGVLNVGIFIVYILIFGFSFLGYWRYGSKTEPAILLNIPKKEVLSQVTKILYAIALYLSYPLQLFPVIQIVWTEGLALKCQPKRRFWYEMLLRIIIVILTALIAIAIPFFEKIVSLNGCIAITMLNIAIPAFLDISIRYPDNYGPGYLALVRDIFLIIFAIFLCISGVVTTFIE